MLTSSSSLLRSLLTDRITDNDGRCGNLLPPGTAIEVGIFKITFFTNEYFTKRGILSFYPFIEVRPVFLLPFGESTDIRGSSRFRSRSSRRRSITSLFRCPSCSFGR